jgi:hypothetical protein
MFFETIPDTSGYMIAGYAVAFLSMGIYIFSMILRSRNLKRDLETLESMQAEKPKTKKTKKK